jgi:hypothetical protein
MGAVRGTDQVIGACGRPDPAPVAHRLRGEELRPVPEVSRIVVVQGLRGPVMPAGAAAVPPAVHDPAHADPSRHAQRCSRVPPTPGTFYGSTVARSPLRSDRGQVPGPAAALHGVRALRGLADHVRDLRQAPGVRSRSACRRQGDHGGEHRGGSRGVRTEPAGLRAVRAVRAGARPVAGAVPQRGRLLLVQQLRPGEGGDLRPPPGLGRARPRRRDHVAPDRHPGRHRVGGATGHRDRPGGDGVRAPRGLDARVLAGVRVAVRLLVRLGWAPPSGIPIGTSVWQAVLQGRFLLPWIVVSLTFAAFYARMVRGTSSRR